MKPPFQSSGRYFGRIAGSRLSSKYRARSPNPSSSMKRFASTTHSWPEVTEEPAEAGLRS